MVARFFMAIFWGVVSAAIGTGFFTAFQLPLAVLCAPLIMITNAHIRSAHRDAFAMAIGGGLVLETVLLPAVPGTFLMLMLLANVVASLFSRKVFTHFSLLSTISLHLLMALLWYGGLALVAVAAKAFIPSFAYTPFSFVNWLVLLLAHVCVAETLTLLSRKVRAAIQTMFLVRPSQRDWQPLL